MRPGDEDAVNLDRRSDSAKPKRPPGRGTDAWAAMAMSALTLSPNGQIQAMLTTQRLGWRADRRSTGTRNALMAHRQRSRRHSMPIAPAAGQRLSPTRFSLTGADSNCGAPRGQACASRRQAKNAIRSSEKRYALCYPKAQNASTAVRLADRAYVMATGRIARSGTGQELPHDPAMHETYLGGAAA